MLLVVPAQETECGRFLKFETLTLCPIDTRPVIADMLTGEERRWLNEYHQRVYEKLSPRLDSGEQEWLRRVTKPL